MFSPGDAAAAGTLHVPLTRFVGRDAEPAEASVLLGVVGGRRRCRSLIPGVTVCIPAAGRLAEAQLALGAVDDAQASIADATDRAAHTMRNRPRLSLDPRPYRE